MGRRSSPGVENTGGGGRRASPAGGYRRGKSSAAGAVPGVGVSLPHTHTPSPPPPPSSPHLLHVDREGDEQPEREPAHQHPVPPAERRGPLPPRRPRHESGHRGGVPQIARAREQGGAGESPVGQTGAGANGEGLGRGERGVLGVWCRVRMGGNSAREWRRREREGWGGVA
eukprot:scaffold6727_cov106-Isochrysis_galbana.AAC.8